MATSTYEVRVDWDNNGNFTDTDDDITSDVIEFSCKYGKSYTAQLFGRSVAGGARFKLKSSAGKYFSFQSASSLFGKLLPIRPIQIRQDGSTIWQGFLNRIIPEAKKHSSHFATLQASGPLRQLTQRQISVARQTSILTGDAVDEVLDGIGWPAADRLIDAGQTTMNHWWTGGKVTAMFACQQLEESEIGFLREQKDGKIGYEDRHHRLKAPHITPRAIYRDADVASVIRVGDPTQRDPYDSIFNIVRATVKTYAAGSLAVLWTQSEANTSGTAPSIGSGDSKVYFASFPNAASATDAILVDVWTTPVSATDYTANSASNGSGTNLTSDISVAVSKFDNEMKITLTNNGTSVAFITLLQARGTPLSESDRTRIESQIDASASIAAFGEKEFPLPGEFIPSTFEAQDFTDFVASVFKDPQPRLTLSFQATRDSDHLAEAIALDVSDRITVTMIGASDLGINEDMFAETVSHRVRAGGSDHVVTVDLSPVASTFGGFWVIGTSELGTDTRLAY